MKREFLEGMGLEKEVIDKILDANSQEIGKYKKQAEDAKADSEAMQGQLEAMQKDMEALQETAGSTEELKKQLETMQETHKKEKETLQNQIAKRAYADAIEQALSEENLKFTSALAKKAYLSELEAAALPIKDGKLEGFGEFHKKQMESSPEAFQGNGTNPYFMPHFMPPMGGGGNIGGISLGAAYAEKFNGAIPGLQKKE